MARRILLVAMLVGLAAAALAVTYGPRYLDRHRYASIKDGCADIPMAPAVTPQTYPGSFLWPYGAVRGCQVLDGGAHPLGDVDVSFVVLLDTDAGPVLARVDYRDTNAGRQYVAAATELDPAGSGDLSSERIAGITQAIAARGGLQPTPWIVHYGDG